MRTLFFLLLLTTGLAALAGFASSGEPQPGPCSTTPGACPCAQQPDWGFFAHRRINRLAVLTLPPEMMVFFKPHIDWISDHAADPDMRRYSTTFEAPRHYIDLDNYGQPPFAELPRTFPEALLQFADIWAVGPDGDTSLVFGGERAEPYEADGAWKRYFTRFVAPRFTDPERLLDVDSLRAFLRSTGAEAPAFQSAFFRESLSAHGILPWHLQKMQRDLTNAFRYRDSKRILRLCADMGHYIGDAHVPLHTTSNYNGQQTGQEGIHGFWESRIPELFADEQYDYFVGKPEYQEQTTDYFWAMVLASNRQVDSVLSIERALRLVFPQDRQMCPDMRNGTVVIAPCRDFAARYQESMNGMVERRMREAIHAVANVWYTAWVDAGQPDLSGLDQPANNEEERKEEEELKKIFGQGRILGRPEEH